MENFDSSSREEWKNNAETETVVYPPGIEKRKFGNDGTGVPGAGRKRVRNLSKIIRAVLDVYAPDQLLEIAGQSLKRGKKGVKFTDFIAAADQVAAENDGDSQRIKIIDVLITAAIVHTIAGKAEFAKILFQYGFGMPEQNINLLTDDDGERLNLSHLPIEVQREFVAKVMYGNTTSPGT